MGHLLAGFIALLAILHLSVVFAQVVRDSPNDFTLCGVSDWYNSTVIPYSFNNNKWGDDGSGYSCMKILEDKSVSVNFTWTGDPSTVKAFPYVKTDPSRMPVQLWNVSTLDFSGKWSMVVQGTEKSSPYQQAVAFDNIALKANVAIDMFLSDNITNSTGLGPPIEIMIWLWYVPAIIPLGYYESTPHIDTVEVAGTNFSLYHGWNLQGQHVFSWLASQNLTSANADYSPLLKYIWNKGLLSGALYLGQLEFGTEIMHAGLPTTFSATNYTLQLYRQGDPDDPNKPVPMTTTSSTRSTSTPTSSMPASTSSAPPATTSKSSAAEYSVPTMNSLQYLSFYLGVMVVTSVLLGAWHYMKINIR